MIHVTFVYPYFENGPMLDLHMSEWSQYQNKDQWKIIIVDDCSTRDPAIDHIRDVGIDLELYRIHTDIPWNQDGARNLGMSNARGWCLMCDMDHLLPAEDADRLITKRRWGITKHYTFKRRDSSGTRIRKIPPNIMLLHNKLFWSVGGYDERFCGYYGSDANFISRLQLRSGRGKVLRDVDLTMYRSDELYGATTTDYGRKGTEYHIKNYPELRDLMYQHERPIKPLNFEYERLI